MRDVLFPAGYVEVKTPLIFNKALWETSGHWEHYRAEHVPHRVAKTRQMGVKPMNCPGHMLVFAQRGAQLSRSADPLPRADAAAPQRSVRRAVGPDARPAVLAGRCALLRHAGADRRRSRAAAAAGAARLRRLRPAVHGEAVDAARRVPGRDRDVGSRRGAAEGGARRGRPGRTRSTRATARSTGRRSTSTSPTRSGGSGSARRSSSTTSMPEQFDLKYIGADNAEHRPVVIHRAIFGSFERFIAMLIEHYAGRVPAVAGAGAGGRAADCGPASRLRARRCATGWRPPGCGSSSTSGRKRLDIRSGRPSCRRFRTCWSSATARRPRARWRCAARTGGDQGAQPVDAFVDDGARRSRAQGARRQRVSVRRD